MSWIQENRFAAGLGGITAVAAAGLIYWGIKAGGTYNQAKEDYIAAADAVDTMASGKLYPSDDNLQAKKKTVADYEKSVGDLQAAFGKYRVPTPPTIEPDVFTANLLKAKEDALKAFAGISPLATEIPAEFSMGLETYIAGPPTPKATGILTYQLEAISELMANLAAAAPTKLIGIHRPALEEESGKDFDAKGKSFRALPVEISFTGSEASFRKFLSSLDDSSKFYFVVRSMRVVNEKLTAPTAGDGKFENAEDAQSEDGAGSNPFGDAGAFVLPGEDAAAPAAGDAAAPAGDAAAPAGDAAAPAPAAGGDGSILQQVLGSEKVHVFLRIDILQFLEAAAAPKAKP